MAGIETPQYQRVAARLRERIRAAQIEPGQVLPSERTLASEYEISRPTVRQAIQLLRNEGLVHVEHGRGAIASPRPRIDRLARTAPEGEFTGTWAVRVWFEPADARIAAILGIEPDMEVTVRDRVLRADRRAVVLATARLPRELTQGTALEQTGPCPGIEAATEYTEEVGARMPTAEERAALGLADGIPVLTVTRIASTGSRVLEVDELIMVADRYRLGYGWAAKR
ncbi:GntR family transcriptional regulator [Sciscionella sediminilitoris]|uniref:GntR family transcriptional regulator n=1 Tax=Sciscionella sediminilitoris TaxID=1445613 RepID=UPI001E2BBF5A|nr:GntR family transcriptional regulator [Sciscionella sp. SE31]